MMETSQDDAVVAALRAAGHRSSEMPAVSSVTVGGPAYEKLLPGDLSCRWTAWPPPTRTRSATRSAATGPASGRLRGAAGPGGDRGAGRRRAVHHRARGRRGRHHRRSGLRLRADITFDLGQQIGGPSAGLVFALASTTRSRPASCWTAGTSPAPADHPRRRRRGDRWRPAEDRRRPRRPGPPCSWCRAELRRAGRRAHRHDPGEGVDPRRGHQPAPRARGAGWRTASHPLRRMSGPGPAAQEPGGPPESYPRVGLPTRPHTLTAPNATTTTARHSKQE